MERVQACGMVPYSSASQAVQDAVARLGPEACVVVMPEGGSTVPRIARASCYEQKELVRAGI